MQHRSTRGERLDVIGFDADDTLWRSEEFFQQAEHLFAEVVAPHAPAGIDVLDVLHAVHEDDHGGGFAELERISDLVGWLAAG